MLSKDQIIRSIWHVDGKFGQPKSSVTKFDNYRPTDKLCLFITQTNLKDSEQRKNINIWCNELPNLNEIKQLWLPSRVNQKLFDAVCKMSNLEVLYIKWSGIKSIKNLPMLTNLQHFRLGGSAQVESIEALGEMTNLITLETEQLNKISDFSVLSKLIQLEGLGIDGGMWKPQKIDTLKPLSKLKKLKYLSVISSNILDKSFDPILELTNLERFSCSWNYPETEFDKLKVLPNLKYGNIETSWKEVKQKLGIK